jgi:hypothetical protein
VRCMRASAIDAFPILILEDQTTSPGEQEIPLPKFLQGVSQLLLSSFHHSLNRFRSPLRFKYRRCPGPWDEWGLCSLLTLIGQRYQGIAAMAGGNPVHDSISSVPEFA